MQREIDYKTIFKSLPIPALVVTPNDPVYTVVEYNQPFNTIVDKPLADLPGKSLFDLFPGDINDPRDADSDRLLRSLRKVIKTARQDRMGIFVLDKSNPYNFHDETKYYDLINIPILNDHEEPELIIHTVRDVTTEQKQAFDNQKNEKRFRALAEHGSDVLWIIGESGNPVYSSPSVENVLGYTVEEILNMDAAQLLHPDDTAHVFSEIQESLKNPGKTLKVTPARMKHKNGSWRWFGGTITNMLHDPAIGGIVDNFRDITDQMNAEKELLEAKNKFQSLIHTIDGIFWEAMPHDFSFTYVSPQVKSILGYTAREWKENPEFWENHIHPEDREESVQYCKYQTRLGQNHVFEYRFRKKDGSYLWVRDVVSVITEKNKPVLLQGFMLDITKQKELELQLERAYEIAKIGNWELNLEKQQLYWSRYVKELHEVDQSYEPDLESAISFYAEGYHRNKIKELVNNAIENGGTFDKELKIITAKGNERWIRVVGEAENQDGKCVKLFGITQNITNKKLAQIQLKETEEKFRNVVEHSTNMFYTHDVDGNLTYLSPQSTHFLGQIPEHARQRWTEFVTDHPVNEIGLYFTNKALETGKTQPKYELQLKKANGELIWVEVNEAPLVKNGEVVALVGSLTDITDRKNYEDKLQESLERYDYVTKATRDAIYDWDIKQNLMKWGDGYQALFGHDPTDKRHSIENWKNFVHPDDREEAVKNLNQTLDDAEKSSWSYEYRFRRSDGDYAHVLEDGFIIRGNRGEALRMVGAIRDITELKKQEELLKESVQEKETLLAEIHHRVKNNLAVISSLMEMQAINSDNEELNQKLIESVLRIKSIAEIHERLYQSSSFANIQFSESIKTLVHDIVKTLRTETDIEISFHTDPVELGIKQSVPCSLLLNEVITNILKHAFSGRKKGHINLTLQSNNSGTVTVEITDDGVGLPPDMDDRKDSSMGLKLIELLTSQIEGEKSHFTKNGQTTFSLTFEKR